MRRVNWGRVAAVVIYTVIVLALGAVLATVIDERASRNESEWGAVVKGER